MRPNFHRSIKNFIVLSAITTTSILVAFLCLQTDWQVLYRPLHIDAKTPTDVSVAKIEFTSTDQSFIIAPTDVKCAQLSQFDSPICVIGGGFLGNLYFTDIYGRPLSRHAVETTEVPIKSDQVFGSVTKKSLETGIPLISGVEFTDDGRLLAAIFSHDRIVEFIVDKELQLTKRSTIKVDKPVGLTVLGPNGGTIFLDREKRSIVGPILGNGSTQFQLLRPEKPWDFAIGQHCLAVTYPLQNRVDVYIRRRFGIFYLAGVEIKNPKYVEVYGCNFVVGSNEKLIAVNPFQNTVHEIQTILVETRNNGTTVFSKKVFEIRGFHFFNHGVLLAHNTHVQNWEENAGISFAKFNVSDTVGLVSTDSTLKDSRFDSLIERFNYMLFLMFGEVR